jgi:hypothetical protein
MPKILGFHFPTQNKTKHILWPFFSPLLILMCFDRERCGSLTMASKSLLGEPWTCQLRILVSSPELLDWTVFRALIRRRDRFSNVGHNNGAFTQGLPRSLHWHFVVSANPFPKAYRSYLWRKNKACESSDLEFVFLSVLVFRNFVAVEPILMQNTMGCVFFSGSQNL